MRQVSGTVLMTGNGRIDLIDNPLVGGVEIAATVTGDTLWSWIEGNQVAGTVILRSQGTDGCQVAGLTGNTASRVAIDVAAAGGSQHSYAVVGADSNVVGGDSSSAVWARMGY